ncbi:MAG: molybdopterin-dependent oxidoreductase [Planctomycetes bacterium]|nr:molybdopterin-dependent oxidoreductase [Planctomycetota bacterium]
MPTRVTLPSVCPLDCPDRCSLDVTVEGDRVVKIDGSTRSPLTDGYICAKVRRFDRRLDSSERILHPMRRTGRKGSGAFERISWDEALQLVASTFRAIVSRSGPEAILPYTYGGSNGFLTSHAMDVRFWNRLGASQLARTLCAANTAAAWRAVFDDLPSAEPAALEHSDAIVLWGVNPSASGIHLVPIVRRAKAKGAFLAVVDPRRTPLAREADLHLPIMPGTDVAVALAMIGVAADERLVDEAFIARFTRGWPELRAAAAEFSPERAAALAHVDPDAIRRFVRAFGRARAPFFRVGWGLERNRNGVDAVRAVVSLRAVLGRFDREGSGVALSTSAGYHTDFRAAERSDLRTRASRTINMSEIARALDETRDPEIAAMFVYNCNPLATAPNQVRLSRALERESLFTVVHEQVFTDTCRYADLVLPATTFLEHRELSRNYSGYSFQWSEPVVAPRGEARSNHDLFASLARAMGFDDAAFAEDEATIARASLAGTKAGQVDLDTLHRSRFEAIPQPRPFEGNLPSRGYVDLAVPPGPPAYRDVPVDATRPLVLISPATDKAISSTLYESMPPGAARLVLSPDDAASRGIRDGDRVRAWNSFGEVIVTATVSAEIPPGVASLPKGLWQRGTHNGWTANALAPDHVDEIGGGACYNDARVDVERLALMSASGRH